MMNTARSLPSLPLDRWFTVVAAFTVAVFLFAFTAPFAVAQPASGPGSPDTVASGPGARDGSVDVTALTNTDTNTDPVAGVVFHLYPITGVDLTTDAGWEAADAYIADPDTATPFYGDPITLPATDSDGNTSAPVVPVGLYALVQDSQDAVTYAPMLFTLPSLDTSSGAEVWAYNLHVYPKPAPDVPPTPTPTPTPSETTPPPPPAPTTAPPRIQAGDGSEFTGTAQWLAIAAGFGLLAAAGFATRKKSKQQAK